MTETELKFLLDAEAAKALRGRLRALPGLEAGPSNRTLRSVYYDTPDGALRRAGIALRLRKDGRRWIQTVKAATTNHGGLQSGQEAEAPAPGGRLDVARIPDAGLRARVETLTEGMPLAAVCETAIKRSLCVLANGHGRAELALDDGEIVAGDRRAPIRELEIELKAGGTAGLFDLAHALLPDGGLRFSRMSKAARGHMLAEAGTIAPALAPRKARGVPLAPGQPVETAARDILRECFDQIARNSEVALALDDPEGPHQFRVGLRRLRSAFLVFRPVIGNDEAARLNAEARWLGREVGAQRDLDVAIVDLLEPEAAAQPDAPGFGELANALRRRAADNRAALRATLAGSRTHAFLFDLGRFVEARGWLAPDDIDQTRRLARPVSAFAPEALDRRWKKAARRARGIDTLSVEERHELRKELKKLRYAVEFFAPVLPQKRVKAFLKRLKALQEVFGDLNDAAMAQDLLTGPDAPAADSPAAQRAVGWLLGTRTERAAHHWREARALWRALGVTKACW